MMMMMTYFIQYKKIANFKHKRYVFVKRKKITKYTKHGIKTGRPLKSGGKYEDEKSFKWYVAPMHQEKRIVFEVYIELKKYIFNI